ncbi:MAG: ABC transporter substrate-binding protein [Proteobacteria bacterium]|nr:ABC transporter substrate-binding protein [Pseudomonadota bacterium]
MGAPSMAKKGKPIIIAVPTSLTFLEGRESINAVKLAVSEINARGGVKVGGVKRRFKVVSIDLRDAAAGVPVAEALLALEKIITQQKPHAIVVGPFRSEALIAGMDIIAKYKVPLLGTIAMSPGSEKRIAKNPAKYKYVFRVSLNAIYLVKYLVGHMMFLKKKFGFNRLFLMNQDVAWARATAGITGKILKKLGWEIVGHEVYPTGASNFASGLLKARLKKAQVIMPVFDMPQSGVLIKQWKALRVPAVMAGFISPMAGQGAWKRFRGRIAGLMNAIFEVGNIPAKKVPASARFYYRYKKKYGKYLQSGHGPAPSYAAVYILKAAIEKAGSLDPDKIVAALKTTDTLTAMGRVKFNKTNQTIFGADPKKAAVGCVFQWSRKGRRVIVFPPTIAEGAVTLPPWMKKK